MSVEYQALSVRFSLARQLHQASRMTQLQTTDSQAVNRSSAYLLARASLDRALVLAEEDREIDALLDAWEASPEVTGDTGWPIADLAVALGRLTSIRGDVLSVLSFVSCEPRFRPDVRLSRMD